MTAPAPRSCGAIPVSSGPASSLAELRVSASSTAAAGGTVTVQSALHVTSDGQRIITGPSMSNLLITRDGFVVGKSDAAQSDIAVPLVLRAGATRPVQVVPASIEMSGCAADVGGNRPPLPAGEYGIVAVLGYRLDPLNSAVDGGPGGGQFHLVSKPAMITVR
jgi:hypothetical protein